MKASYRWLCELYASSTGAALDASPAQVAERFTGAGLEVESFTPYGVASASVRLARVTGKAPHPTKAKLTLVTVELGGGQTQQVVCGAPNVPEPGAGMVVLAPLGTHLPAKGMTMEPREIAGVRSEGMLCSAGELGLFDAHEGILVLPEGTAAPGTSLADAIPATHDTIFEIGLTPNRPDGLGHVGLARELAALSGATFTRSAKKPARTSDAITVQQAVAIRIDDAERCPQYGAARVDGVKVVPSPLWLRCRLEALGVRSISNVVDVTNLVMLHFGHPIHAFDRAHVGGGAIVVRRAVEGEALTTLDGVARKLTRDDLVIADANVPSALAGVMGGAGSEIRDTTSDVLIECAYFQPRGVRRTSRRYGLHTESSHRFERGVDPGDVADVLDETAHWLVELAGGTAASTHQIVGAQLAARAPITLRAERLEAIVGAPVPWGEAVAILERLGCVRAGDAFVPPTHRPDLSMEEDLVEEVVRVRGMDAVPVVLPQMRPQPPRTDDTVRPRLVRAAIELGLSESLLFGFTAPETLATLGAPPSALRLENPLGEERSVMRTSLLPGLFDALRRARRHGVSDVRLFATGARFLARRDDGLAHEARTFSAVIAGHRDAVLEKPAALDVWDAKGLAVALVERAMGRVLEVAPMATTERPKWLHPRGAATLSLEGRVVGSLGPVHPEIEAALDLGGPALVIELDVDALEAAGVRIPRFRPIPTLPASTRDLAVVVHDDVPAGQVEAAVREAAGELCESVAVFDVFRGGSVPADHRSLAFHVVYRDPKAASRPDEARTLTDAEVDTRHKSVVELVGSRFGAQLRA